MLTCAKILLFSLLSWGASNPLDWSRVASDFVILNDVVPVDRTWLRMQAGESVALGYDAGLVANDHVPVDCRWERFKHDHRDLEISVLTSKYLESCESQIRSQSWGWWEDYYRTMFVRLKISEHPYLRRVFLRLPNGYQQPALLALKDTTTRRPLIIFRAGIFGNSVDIQAERHLIMQLFEQGPFNLLFLDSATSPETVRWNTVNTAGGLDEGLQNYQIAERLLRPSEPLSKLIDGIHLLGISMGGHSLWMTLALNQVNKPLFKSAVAFCPLVQFEKTFLEHQSHPVDFFLMNFWAYMRLAALRDRWPGLSVGNFLMDAFHILARSYKGPITDDGKVLFPLVEGFRKDDYFSGNNLLPLIRTIRVPVTVFSSEIETLVPYDLNYKVLEREVSGLPNFHLFALPTGFHCTFPGAYDWDQFSMMVKDQYLERLPELRHRYNQGSVALPVAAAEIPNMPLLSVQAVHGGRTVDVSFQSTTGITVMQQIPIGQLDWGTADYIRSESEARALIRWTRNNLRVEREPAPRFVWDRLKKPD